MFDLSLIPHAEYLDAGDVARAEKMVADGMSPERAFGYLAGWASDMAYESCCDTRAAIDFEDRAYGRRNE